MTKKINPFDEMLRNAEANELFLEFPAHLKHVAKSINTISEDRYLEEQRCLNTLAKLMIQESESENPDLEGLISTYITVRMGHISNGRRVLMEENDMLKISMKEVVVH